MEINDILSKLGLDFSNPETKRGALEAIEAILGSRSPISGADLGGGGLGGEMDVELDPDLIQPSVKHSPQVSDDDIEIEDEEHILDQIKHNESEDDIENNSAGQDSSEDSSDSEKEDSEDTSDLEPSEDNSDKEPSKDDTSKASEKEPAEDEHAEPDEKGEDENAIEPDAEGEEEDDSDKKADSGDSEESEDDSAEDDVEGDSDGENEKGDTLDGDLDNELDNEEEEGEESDEEDDFEFDEDDLLDDEVADSIKNKEEKTKTDARKLKRERTLAAAKKALEKAKTNKAAPALIRELEKAIEALEALTEAVAKNIGDISDEEFNLLINRVFEAIDAIGDSGLTYTSQEERNLRAQEIKADLSKAETQNELSAEDIAQIRAEHQATKAKEKEAAKYVSKARGSFKGFQDFLNSLYRAIALQVHNEEIRNDSWSAISRRNSGAGVLRQGKKVQKLPNKKIPVIDFYFDCSASWTPDDITVGKKAVSALADMEQNGQIKINIYYFSDEVSQTYEDVEGGCTSAWNYIVKNIIATQATNVIVMTDGDMERQGKRGAGAQDHLKYTVPGYVWYLWKNGENAPRLPRDLHGSGPNNGVQQFSFNSSDV
jgi:hypothetical protein